jgi:hypothetical protein
VGIKRGATIEFTRVRSPRPVDEFDLDVRLGGAGAAPELLPDPGTQFIGTCVGVACRGGTDRIATCVGPVCNATERPTCQTCQTRSAAATCR